MLPSEKAFWQTKDPVEAADALRSFAARFATTQTNRRNLAMKYGTAVEGMTLSSLGPWGYTYSTEVPQLDSEEIPIVENLAHALVDTLTSKIGAIDPPLPAMLTSKGSWRDRRQAADLELLVRAEYATPKGFHATLHDMWIAALRLAAGPTGASAVQYFNDGGKLGARLHDTLSMFWSNDLRVQGCITWLPVEDAVELYPDSEDQIRAAAGEPPLEWGVPVRSGEKLVDFVAIYEGYRGASAGGKKPGQRVVCVKDGPALEVEAYPHQRPPFVWLVCIPHLYGPLGHSMIHHVYEAFRRDNLIRSRIDKAINKTNESTTYADRSKLVNPEALTTTQDKVVVWVNDGNYKPHTESAPGFSSEHLSVAERHAQTVHAVSGLAQSQTGGTRQQGVDSAIGQRYVAALVNERFAALQRRYVHAVAVDSAEVIVQVLCDIFQDDPKMLRLAPGQDTLREVSGAVALKGIEQLKYVVQPAAVSGSKGNPADRMQSAYELKQLGIMSDAGFAAMQAQGGLDLPEAVDDTDIQHRWFETQMHRWSFASDKDVEKPDFYLPPLEHVRPGEALAQVVDGYLEAQLDGLEPERLEFYFMMISDLSQIAASRAQGPGAPPGTSPPGAPQAPALPTAAA